MKRTVNGRRPPTLYALGAIVALTVTGIGMFVWGPVNPNVQVSTQRGDASAVDWIGALLGPQGSFGMGQSVGLDGRASTHLVMTNHSLATVRLVDVRVVAMKGATVPAPIFVKQTGIPARLSRGETADVDVTVDARSACIAHHGGDVRYQVLVDVRSASGVIRTVGGNGHQSVTCSAGALPVPGIGPSDIDGARRAIIHAFTTAYDFGAPSTERRRSIDDSASLDAAVGDVTTGPYSEIAKAVRVRVVEVVFTSPTRAAVLYDLEGTGSIGAGRIGQARLVDGHWKVTLETVCADLRLAQVTCPPG